MRLYREPEPGDLIEIFRNGYQHWSIYVGDEYVIHVVRDANSAILKKEKLQDVAGKDEYHVNNLLDDTYKPRPIEVILEEAKCFVGKEFPYNLLLNNCEHFATLMRYGKPHSHQAEQAKNKLIVAMINAGNVYGIVALATIIPKKEGAEADGEDEL